MNIKGIKSEKIGIKTDNEAIISIINNSISHHEKMKNAYFFNTPGRSRDRRKYEDYHSWHKSFSYHGDKYAYWSRCTCSCRNVYFSDGFTVNGQKKNVTAFKKVLKELTET